MQRDIIGNEFPNILDQAKKELNKILQSILDKKKHQKRLESYIEETCDINSPLSFWSHHGGIDSTYIVFTPFCAVIAEVGDEGYEIKTVERKKAIKDYVERN